LSYEHIAVDKYDNIYVTDPQSDPGCSQQPRVLKFDSQGHFVTKWGSYGKGEGQFRDPEHLAVDSDGNLYVSDRKNESIQVFQPVSKYQTFTSPARRCFTAARNER